MSTSLKLTFAFLAGLVVATGLAFLMLRHRAAVAPPAAATQQPVAAPATPDAAPAPPPAVEATANAEQAPEEAEPAHAPAAHPAAESKRRPTAFARAAASPAQAATGQGQNTTPVASPGGTIASAKDLPDLRPEPATPAAGSGTAAQASQPAPAAAPEAPAVAAPPAPPAPHTVTIDAGTNLVVRISEPISTERNASGDAFRCTLEQPIILDGFIIADKGSTVRGKVVKAEKAGHMTGTSELELTLMEINTTDGQTVPVHTALWSRQGPKSTGENAAKVGGGALLGALIGAVAGGGKGAAIGAGAGGAAGTGVMLATHGKPVVLPVETKLTFRLDKPAVITEQIRH